VRLIAALQAHAAQTPLKTALRFEGQHITYGALWQRILDTEASLRQQGVQSGDRVAWLALNDPQLVVLLFALARIGAILLPLNHRLALAELQVILDHAQASLLMADAAHQASAGRLTTPARDNSNTSPPSDSGADLPALLVYTSGTTGQPKGALHTQAGLLANCIASQHAHAFTPDDHVLTALPMFHVGGLCIQTLPALYAGAQVTLHARFDAGAWLHDVQAQKPSMSLLVPATMRAVINHPAFASTDLSSLQLLNAGSSTVPLSLIEAFHARGIPVCQVYGATETGPVSIYLLRGEAMQHAGSAGRAGLNVAVRLVDDSGCDVPAGEVGEIWLRAPNLMRGYWRYPDNAAFQAGWFHTGDLARCDAGGYYWVVGRNKDMVISGGENIYPAELENILADCPDIAEAAVIGQPDAHWGEVAVAVVVKHAASAINAPEVLALFDGKLARFKHPRRVVFVEALPKTALGKVQKSALASLVQTVAPARDDAP
jgi:fatty-acyl-CoA synthase